MQQHNKNIYEKEFKLMKLIIVASLLSIIMAALGLFGLSYYFIGKRIKEIGIRKVNGAKTIEILQLLNQDFIKWVIIAFIIAAPTAYIVMTKWLQNFAYKTTLSWWVFAIAGFTVLLIALITVSWQTFRAARRNPVEALRYE
jgi:putative ABC transport system permease protein